MEQTVNILAKPIFKISIRVNKFTLLINFVAVYPSDVLHYDEPNAENSRTATENVVPELGSSKVPALQKFAKHFVQKCTGTLM